VKTIQISNESYTSIRGLATQRGLATDEAADVVIGVGMTRLKAVANHYAKVKKMAKTKAAKKAAKKAAPRRAAPKKSARPRKVAPPAAATAPEPQAQPEVS
jgi:hypothetical protein